MSGQVVHPVVCSPLNEHMMFQSPRVGASSSPPRPQSGRRIPRRVSIPSCRGKLFTNGGKAYGFVREFQSPHGGASSSPPQGGCYVVFRDRVSIPSCRGKFFTQWNTWFIQGGEDVSIPSCRGKFFTPMAKLRFSPSSCFNPLVSGQVLHPKARRPTRLS